MSIDISKFSFQYLIHSLLCKKKRKQNDLGWFLLFGFLNVIFFSLAIYSFRWGAFFVRCPAVLVGLFFGGKNSFCFFLWKNLVKCAASNLSSICVCWFYTFVFMIFMVFFVLFCFFVCFFFSFIVTYSDYSGAGWCFGWCLVFVVRAKHMKMTYVLKRRKLLTQNKCEKLGQDDDEDYRGLSHGDTSHIIVWQVHCWVKQKTKSRI